MKKIVIPSLISLLLYSCGPSQTEYDTIIAENKGLKEQITNLKIIIENYENSPDRLIHGIDELVKDENIDKLREICEKLEKYHPTSTEYQKAKKNLQTVIEKQEARKKAAEAKRLQAVNRLKKEYDDVSGITWYKNPYFTHYNNRNLISLYIGQDGNSVWLRLKMSYEGDEWIFFENAYLSYDENTKTILFDKYDNKDTESGYGGRVWEWIDVNVDESLYDYLKEFVNGKSLKMRLSGKYTRTRTISGNEKQALQDVLLAYDVLKYGE